MAKYQGKYSKEKHEYAEIEKSYNGIAPAKRRKPRKKESSAQRAAIIGICVGVIILALAVLFVGIYFAKDDGVILDNVSVAGIYVGGMTKAEAEDAVYAATKNTIGKKTMVVTVLDSTVEIPANAIRDLDIESAVEDAYAFGNKGSKSKRETEREIAETVGYAVDLTPYLNVDKKLIENALDELGSAYNSTLKEHSYTVVGDKPSNEQIQKGENLQVLIIQVGVPEYGLDMDALYKKVMAAYSDNKFSVSGECDAIAPEPIDFEAILEQYYVEPENAKQKSGTKEIIPGLYGYGFDLSAAEKAVSEATPGSQLEIPFIQIEPEITAENIGEKMFPDQLSTWTADQESDENRATNLRLACEAINGIILNPGETFSYNQTLGERTEERGYKPGASYSGGQTVYTIGGGICQVSSALYYCTLLADLEIVYRDCHGFAQEYVPLGMDAMVSWGSTDFLFRNNRSNPIQIKAEADGGKVVISINGIDDEDYTVKMEYEVLSETPSTTTTKKMTADEAKEQGYEDGEYIVDPYHGYEVITYRCKYDKETNELISKEEEATSVYRARDGVKCEIIE